MKDEEYIIKQLSIFSENKSGKLAAISKVFLETGVSVQAFSIAEANNFGVVRAIVDKPDVAFAAFAKQNYALQYTDVLAVKMEDVPGGLFKATHSLGELGINIEYAFAFRSEDHGVLIIKVADIADTVAKIKGSDLQLLPAKEFNF